VAITAGILIGEKKMFLNQVWMITIPKPIIIEDLERILASWLKKTLISFGLFSVALSFSLAVLRVLF
jgi:hypothetical protein